MIPCINNNTLLFVGSKTMIVNDKSCLSKKCELVCEKVYSMLVELVEKIMDGTATFHEITLVIDSKQHFLKLCTSMQECKIEEINEVLELRSRECYAYKEHKYLLASFSRELEVQNLLIEG